MRRILPLLALLLTAIGCGVRKDHAYTYHREQVSEQQYLNDQSTLRSTPGVQYAHGERGADGKASLKIGVKEGYDILIQEKMSALGWTRAQH